MTDNPSQPTESTPPPAEAQNTVQEHMIPKSRFDEVNSKFREAQAQLEAMQAAAREAQTKQLEEQQRYKELYEKAQADLATLQSASETATRYQTALQATNEARIAQVPEAQRTLVPDYDDPVKLGAWLDANLHLLTQANAKPTPPKLDGGSGQGARDEAQRAMPEGVRSIAERAQAMGYQVNPENVAKYAKR